MIITRGYANRLVRDGKATKDGHTRHDNKRYQIVIRHDVQRVDHYLLHPGQATRIQVRYVDNREAVGPGGWLLDTEEE